MGWFDLYNRVMGIPADRLNAEAARLDAEKAAAAGAVSELPIDPRDVSVGQQVASPSMPELPGSPGLAGIRPSPQPDPSATVDQWSAAGPGVYTPTAPVSKTAGGPKVKLMGSVQKTGLDEATKKSVNSEVEDWATQMDEGASDVASATDEAVQKGIGVIDTHLADTESAMFKARAHEADARQKHDTAFKYNEEMRRLKDKSVKDGVDPQRYWRDMPAGEKAMKLLGIAFEGLGKGLIRLGGGTPEAGSQVMKMIQASVDADISAQKQNIMNTMRNAGYSGEELARMDKIYDKRKAEATDILLSRHKLEMLKQAYNEKDPEIRKFRLDIADKIGQAEIKTAQVTGDTVKSIRHQYGAVGGSGSVSRSASGASKISRGVSSTDVASAKDSGSPDPLTHTLVNGKWLKSPQGFKNYEYTVAGKAMHSIITRPGSFRIGGKDFAYGREGLKLSDMKKLGEKDHDKFSNAEADMSQVAEIFKSTGGRESWSLMSKIKTYIDPNSIEMLMAKIKDSAAMRKAVRDGAGRATDLENKMAAGTLVSTTDARPVAVAKIRLMIDAIEKGLRVQAERYNFQETDATPVIAAWMSLQRIKSFFPKSAGGKAKELKSLEAN